MLACCGVRLPLAIRASIRPRSTTVVATSSQNPFLTGYIVDVMVETVRGRPVLYKILAYHGDVDIPEQDGLDLDDSPTS